jgi:hypothetical protein
VGLGNRRFLLCVLVGAVAVTVLSGCSVSASTYASNPAAVAIGAQAIGFASSDSSSGSSQGWTSSQPCSTALQSNIEAGAPAGLTLTLLDPSTVSGPLSDPNLTHGDVATCAFHATSTTELENQEFFVGMPQSYVSKYAAKLVADGFVAGPTISETQTPGTQQTFTKGLDKVAIVYSSNEPGLLAIFG